MKCLSSLGCKKETEMLWGKGDVELDRSEMLSNIRTQILLLIVFLDKVEAEMSSR
ncbi:hypothetical protein Phum_PHUM091050 [Pediculus humanus corporis]|uniref:Uncharacterized protein n=1 Tax=Pediculus humanus subsp. corporis TaxID=121224 RepID=E0VCN0_PEDHC|nr:uncharacterized protein Phum_PHUM091050 [Pediculus humanus corporis]EEB11136.1 hypothetical protein Phum_PHUM091050 [Pediculus humanus corporis]